MAELRVGFVQSSAAFNLIPPTPPLFLRADSGQVRQARQRQAQESKGPSKERIGQRKRKLAGGSGRGGGGALLLNASTRLLTLSAPRKSH